MLPQGWEAVCAGTGVPLVRHSCEGLPVGLEEASRRGRVGGRVLGPRGQGHTLHRRRWFVLSSRPTVSLLPPPPLLSRKSS